MPFNEINRVIYGDDARRAPSWARDRLVDYLDEKLNDPDGPYYEPLGLSETRTVTVSGVAAIADALYSVPEGEEAAPNPVVFVGQGSARAERGGKTIGGTAYRGQRWHIELELDSGVMDANIADTDPASDNPADQAHADEALADAVTDCLTRGRSELLALGLIAVRITNHEAAQRANVGRNPRLVCCTVIALDAYTP